jgi:HAMP domain-containing protein
LRSPWHRCRGSTGWCSSSSLWPGPFAPIRQALWRAAILLLLGTALAAALAYWLAQSLVGPIRLLEEGTERLGAGQLEHRIRIATGDELEALAEGFSRMAAEIALSQQRRARIARLRRFLAPQVAEHVERAGDETVLAAQQPRWWSCSVICGASRLSLPAPTPRRSCGSWRWSTTHPTRAGGRAPSRWRSR